jgi:hypothetical protein
MWRLEIILSSDHSTTFMAGPSKIAWLLVEKFLLTGGLE